MIARTLKPDARPLEDKPRRRWGTYFGANSLALSILLHVLFGIGATYLIVEHFTKKHVNFHASEPPAPQQVEHKVQLARRNNQESAPPDLKRIVTTDVSAITLPEPPDIPTPDVTTTSPLAGVDGTLGLGDAMGGGGGGSGGGGGGSPMFGAPDGNGMKGYFYDLKQTPDHKPIVMSQLSMVAEVRDFCANGWDEDALAAKNLRSPNPLYANQILTTQQPSEVGPQAFGMDKVCQPGYWLAIYHITVTTGLSGTYRVAGYGDDFLIVRINGATVLDSGWNPPVTSAKVSAMYNPTWASSIIQKERNYDKSQYYRTVVGDSFDLASGASVQIDVLIGDATLYGSHGACAFSLFLLQDGRAYEKDSTGFPIFPLLQIQPDANVKRNGIYPPYTCKPEDAMESP